MSHSPEAAERFGTGDATGPEDFEERAMLEEGLRRLREDQKRALADPGPTWKEWFLYRGSKWYIGLLCLILDGVEIASFLPFVPPYYVRGPELVGVLAPTLYLEFLLYRYLWYVPPQEQGHSRSARFRSTWLRPVEFGRWTAEAARIRAGERPPTAAAGPDPREFL